MTRRVLFLFLALCLLPGLALAAKTNAKAPVKAAAKISAKTPAKIPAKAAKAGKAAKAARTAAQAVPELVCPESAGLGEPFLLRVRAKQPLTNVRLTWLGRTAQLTGRLSGRLSDHLSGRTVPGGWEAVALLGSDVGNSATGRHELVLRWASARGKGGELRRGVRLLPVERPVESLELDEAMVTPPREAHARILAERNQIQGLMLGTLKRTVPAGADGADGRRWALPLLRPVPGTVSSMYGIGRVLNGQRHAPHRGLDLEADIGQPVLAVADGTVLFAGELYYAGNAVYVDHGQGLVSASFHQSELRVRTGDTVSRGQILGLAGDTGRSTRPHLHFGIWAWGRYVDPEPLFLYDPLP